MPETLYSLGKSASLQDDPNTAQAAWTRVLLIEKDSPLAAQAHFGLAEIYRKQGKTAEAEREMSVAESWALAAAGAPDGEDSVVCVRR